MAKQLEFEYQCTIAEYLSLKYPDVLFQTEALSNVKLSIPQAVRLKRLNKFKAAMPDIIILKPSGMFHGLCIEMKTESPFRKDGKIKSRDLLRRQLKTLLTLKDLGYRAMFCWSIEMAQNAIDDYLLRGK
jgi:hypothetical protein